MNSTPNPPPNVFEPQTIYNLDEVVSLAADDFDGFDSLAGEPCACRLLPPPPPPRAADLSAGLSTDASKILKALASGQQPSYDKLLYDFLDQAEILEGGQVRPLPYP